VIVRKASALNSYCWLAN